MDLKPCSGEKKDKEIERKNEEVQRTRLERKRWF